MVNGFWKSAGSAVPVLGVMLGLSWPVLAEDASEFFVRIDEQGRPIAEAIPAGKKADNKAVPDVQSSSFKVDFAGDVYQDADVALDEAKKKRRKFITYINELGHLVSEEVHAE